MMEQKEQERSRASKSPSSMFGSEMTKATECRVPGGRVGLEDGFVERDNGWFRTAAPQEGILHALHCAYQTSNCTLG